nr:hypothetical protein [Tanacetum cinerariifolium]
MFRINPFKTSKEEKHVPNNVRASARTKPVTVSQPPVFTKKDVNSDSNGLSSTGVDNTKTRRPQPRSNTKNDRVTSASKSSRSKNKGVKVEEHHMNLLFSKNTKHMSSACNNIKLDSQNVISKVVCAMCKQCLISVDHDVCLHNYVKGKTSRGKKQRVNVSIKEKQKKHQPKVKKPKKEKSKRASHPSKPVPNSRQRLHLLHMDLCGPMRIASINGKQYVLVIVDDYSRYTWSPVTIIRTDNDTEFKNQVLKEYFDSVGISHQVFSVRTPQQNGVVERRNRTLVEAARKMLIFSRAPLFLWAEAIATAYISFLHVFGALCYPKNDREDIGKLVAKGDIGFFIAYSADFCAYRIYNRRSKKIMETINVSFDELSAMAFEQRSSKPRLQSMTSGQISSGLDLSYAPSTKTTQQPTEDAAPTPTNSSSHATTIPITSQDVDELNPNAMVDGNTFVNPFANPSTSAAESSSSHNMILSLVLHTLGDAERDVNVNETFHEQTNDELSEKELKQIEADDQAIQTILLGLPEDIYAAVDSCETAQEIWLRPEWSRHVTIIHQTKDLHTADYTQLYDFLKYNQKEVDELKAERLVKIQDPLALMENSNNPNASPAPHQDLSPFNQNYIQQSMPNPEDIIDSTTAMNMALALMAKAFKL